MKDHKTINIQYSTRWDYPAGLFESMDELSSKGIPYSRFLGALMSKYNQDRKAGNVDGYRDHFREWGVKFNKLEDE